MKKAILFTAIYFSLFQIFAQTDPGKTNGVLDVSLTGAATYTVPISTPPGIKDVVPQIALSYNSQGGNGIAGWGWNISGLSAISRIPATEYHDGFIDPVDFDDMDRFALDGQRLLLVDGTGNYGAPGSEYVTENYSNIKIVAYETHPDGSNYGPKYFKVFYPNGNIATYGWYYNSTGKLQWGISQWKDPQYNIIKYFYTSNANTQYIRKIKYGGHGSQQPNEIQLNYNTNRERPEQVYVAGISFTTKWILANIQVKANGNLLRKYNLTHESTSLGYDKLTQIQEENGAGGKFEPIVFNYEEETIEGVNRTINSHTISEEISSENKDKVLSGDFDGDGNLDMLTYNDNQKNHFHLFYDNLSKNKYKSTGSFSEIFASNILTSSDKLEDRQSITVAKSSVSNDIGKVEFVSYKLIEGGSDYIQTQQTRTWNDVETYVTDINCGQTIYDPPIQATKIVPKKYISGDFNADGITDILAINKNYTVKSYDWWENPYDEYDCIYYEIEVVAKQAHLINLDRRESNFIIPLGELVAGIKDDDILQTGDFNGDGKTDLYHFREDHYVDIYSLNTTNDQLIRIHHQYHEKVIDDNYPVYMGDFNGDGKSDFVVPENYYLADHNWVFFLSTGNSFQVIEKEIIDFDYYSSITTLSGDGTYYLKEFFYIPIDYNNDGKTDFIRHNISHAYDEDDEDYTIPVVQYIKIAKNILIKDQNSSNCTPTFEVEDFIGFHDQIPDAYGIPVLLNHNQYIGHLSYAYIDGDKIDSYKFLKDHKIDMTLEMINNNGIQNNIHYAPLEEAYQYETDNTQVYPFVNINLAPQFNIVYKITEESGAIYRWKNFKYKGAVSHIGGLGFIGFSKRQQSSLSANGISNTWQTSLHNPQKRGAIINQWTSSNHSNYETNYISKTSYQYQTSGGNGNVFINLPETVDSQNKLGDTSQKVTYTYDSFNNVEHVETKFYNGYNYNTYVGKKTLNNTYYNNPTPTDHTYHIGRLDAKTETADMYGDIFTTTEDYDYHGGTYGNLVQYYKKKGNGTNWITEKFNYDSYGNLTRKELMGYNRVETFQYHTDKRFLYKATDIEGLVTTYTYNVNTGNVLSEIDPYGNNTTYEYDNWGRKKKEIDYLGNETTISLSKLTGGGVYKQTIYPDGQKLSEKFNAFGWLFKKGSKSLNGYWVNVETVYDDLGRKEAVSDPYFSGDPKYWTTYDYDYYGRPEITTLPTGKVITTSYNGRTVTVDDGTKTVTTTKDAAGNTISVTDEGGTINYTYYANGAMKTANYGGRIVEVQIDGWGRKIQLDDPDAGTYTYDYNDIGELLEETTPRGTTTYDYDDFGKIETKTIFGDHTDMDISYSYNITTKLLESVDGYNHLNSTNNSHYYEYDDKMRLKELTEEINSGGKFYTYKKILEYDDWGRVEYQTYRTTIMGKSGTGSVINTKNNYNTQGILHKIKDVDTGVVLWQLGIENAYGQPESIALGNDIVKYRSYDEYGFPEIMEDKHAYNGDDPVLDMYYNFNSQKATLSSRDRSHNGFNSNESYAYDTQDRLTYISSPFGNHTQTYDDRGRITSNSNIGSYSYAGNNYQANKVRLNAGGNEYYSEHTHQDIVYNAFKKPVWIHEEGYGRVDFEYNPISMSRATAYYGSDDKNVNDRPYKKHYSSIIPVEITEDTVNGSIKIATFVGGDAYSAPIVHIKETGENAKDDYYYLHRDYLGSILAITDSDANIVEQRQFGAWGKTDKFLNSTGDEEFNHTTSLLNRGYTGHEHFFGVGLIHMNGRLYDAKLGRFLAPDNFVQDPYNTQNFNRYSYVLNNPLKYVDPSGEFIWMAVMAGALINMGMTWMKGGSFGEILLAGAIGAATGIIAGGVANLVAQGLGIAGTFTAGFFGNAAMSVSGFGAGAAVGGLSGMAAGFAGGMMNTFANGGNFADALGAGIKGGISGAFIGAAVGGVSGAIKAHKEDIAFAKFKDATGIEPGDPVPATDEYLKKAQETWFPDAPMEQVNKFTVDNPKNYTWGNESGITRPLTKNGILTGRSNVYFNKDVAFTSAKELYKTMGHELLHVSQISALEGIRASAVVGNGIVREIMEFHAYSYHTRIAGTSGMSFSGLYTRSEIQAMMLNEYYQCLHSMNFEWTFNTQFSLINP